MKRLFIFLPLVGLIFLSGCGTTSTVPVVETGTVTTTIIDCQNDINCIQKNFLACTSATFTPPFSASSSLNLEIVWETNDICDYKITRSIQGMLVSKECKMPMTLITIDRANYLFLSDKDPMQLAVAPTQSALDTQYCTEN
jgi:hypothetical protein